MSVIQIVNLTSSDRKSKRLKVTLNDGKSYNFGLKGSSTYIDNHDISKRANYIARHMGNPIEKERIDNLIPSPALFSMYLLWGPYTDIHKNVTFLNNLFRRNRVTIKS